MSFHIFYYENDSSDKEDNTLLVLEGSASLLPVPQIGAKVVIGGQSYVVVGAVHYPPGHLIGSVRDRRKYYVGVYVEAVEVQWSDEDGREDQGGPSEAEGIQVENGSEDPPPEIHEEDLHGV